MAGSLEALPPAKVPLVAVPLVEQGSHVVRPIGEGGSQPALALEAWGRGSSSHRLLEPEGTIQETHSDAGRLGSMRGAVLADDLPYIPSMRSTFSLRGELMHAFISYRVSTEGPAVNGLAARVVGKIRSMSTDSKHGLAIPRHGWGSWPQSVKRPVPFRPEEAKVYLDKDCLQDGQSWLAGFVQGLAASMTFVPLISWTEDDKGSVGELCRIGVDGFDRVDNVLLELIIATALREEPGAAVQAILPVLIGPARGAAEGGGFSTFPFGKLARLSDAPSKATNARASQILRQLGLREDKVLAVLGRSVKQVVHQVLRNQGVQAWDFGGVDGVVAECATRVLTTVLQEMRRLRSDPKYFEQGRPMGSEVLAWLQEANLRSYAPLLVHHHIDSLAFVARLTPEGLTQLCDEHEELFPRSGRKGALGGELLTLQTAHSKLLQRTPARFMGLIPARPDERTLPLSERLERYRDTQASAMAIATCGHGLELMHTTLAGRGLWVSGWLIVGLAVYFNSFVGLEVFGRTDRVKIPLIVVTFGVALLPLVTSTARMFASAVQWAHPLVLFSFLAAWFFEWTATGNSFMFWYWLPLFLSIVFILLFRRKYFLVGHCLVCFLGYVFEIPVVCAIGSIEFLFEYDSYAMCVMLGYSQMAVNLMSVGGPLLFLLVRKFVNYVGARRAAGTSRESHRALWREELSKVASSPEVLDDLQSLAEGIALELQEQRRQAVRSLDVVGGVMAFLNQRVGRWSLRGERSKARQAHGDIDLLFDEAAMVNEPFQDLVHSLVAGIRGFDADTDSTSSKSGLVVKRGPIKKPERALQKLVRVYERDVAMLTDLVRCTVLAEDLRQVEALMATLDARSVVGLAGETKDKEGDEEELVDLDQKDEGIMLITSISNRFDESYDDTSSGGYRDLSVSVEVGWSMRDGIVSFESARDWEALECQRHICEIQVHLRSSNLKIVNGGLHARYVELRNQYNG